MKSKHFDSIIMDDIVNVTANVDDAKVREHAKAIEKLVHFDMKRALLPRGNFKTTMGGIYGVIQTIWEDERDPLRQHVLDLFEEAEGVDLQAPQSQER